MKKSEYTDVEKDSFPSSVYSHQTLNSIRSMKRIYLILSAALLIVSCVQNELESNDIIQQNENNGLSLTRTTDLEGNDSLTVVGAIQSNKQVILWLHVKQTDGKYSLDMSPEYAAQLGIDNSQYSDFVEFLVSYDEF